MRWTSFVAGLMVLLAVVAGLGWAMRTTSATQQSHETPTGVVPPDDPALADDPEVKAPRAPKDAGMQTSNPFQLSEDGTQPKVVVDEIKYNFDRLSLGATGHHDFVIRNEGAAPLKLAKGESTCKCTVFNIGADEIPPGGSATVHLEWKPIQIAKVFQQSANVWTNDPQQPELELTVEGAVTTLVQRIPEGSWIVGTLREGQPTTVSGVILSSVLDAFEILSVETSSPDVQVTYEPLDAAGLERHDARSGYALTCSVQPNMPVGTFSELVKVALSLKEAPVMQFSVQGARVGPYQIIGPGWTQDRHTLRMGRCSAATGMSTKISLFVAVPDGFDLSFEAPQVTPPILNASIQKDDAFASGGGRQRFFIQLEAPAGITPGRWNGDTAIKVALKCNHPSVQTAVFHVDLQAD